MPNIYGPTPTSTISQAQAAADAFVDQIESIANSKSSKGAEQAETKQWAEMTALANILLEIEGGE